VKPCRYSALHLGQNMRNLRFDSTLFYRTYFLAELNEFSNLGKGLER
jgi:hypothetical protein